MFPPRRLRRLVLPPAAERAVAEAAVRFKISTSISRRAHRRSSVSSPAGSFLLRPVSCLRAVAHAVLEGEGPAVALAAEIGFDDAKLEIPGIAAVPPRPVHGPDAALVDSLQGFTVDFARPNSFCGMAMAAPSAYPSAKRCLNSAEQSPLGKSTP